MIVQLGNISVVTVLLSGLFLEPTAHADDQVVGRIWEIKFEARNPQNEILRKFRATPDGKVWNMPEQGKPREIGEWTGDERNTKMTVTGTIGPNGKFEIVQIGKDPPRWQGEFVGENGVRRPVKIRLLKD